MLDRLHATTVNTPFPKASSTSSQSSREVAGYDYMGDSSANAARPVLKQSRPRILIADDHTLVAEACKNLLDQEFDVVGIVADGRALLRASAVLRPDVIVSDIAMQSL